MIYRFVVRVEVPEGDREDRPEIQKAVADSSKSCRDKR
mgnify:CR=1 FL=1